MTEDLRPDAASARQIQAADPASSTWLVANAGSGKTRVLTDRVARLLLRGVAPGRILCLTYTKAAAGEMQNRLFARLGEWAMLEDAALRAALARLGVERAPDADTLRRARRLFARAIETPGGLKIQTIHAFCAGLLRRFPLEAGVSPAFAEMDDRAAALLREDVLEHLAETAPDRLDAIARQLSGETGRLTREIAGAGAFLLPARQPADLWALFGLPPGLDAERLLAEVFIGGEAALLETLRGAMAAGSANDVKQAPRLPRPGANGPGLADLEALEGLMLFGAKAAAPQAAKIGTFPTKATRTALGEAAMAAIDALMLRVEAARPRRLALAAAERALALHRFAAVFLPEYERRKALGGRLDFDDLIRGAVRLLSDRSVAQWVLYKLDGGVDHILVDEAQDTSPEQWRVIELLAQEFTAGSGVEDERRSVFVVGDRKQSIYSFQGADLRSFDRMHSHFGRRLPEMGVPWQTLLLEHSFRSAPAILRLVDLTFDDRRGRGLGGAVRHHAFHAAMPGRVDLWPAVEPAATQPRQDWFDPVDILGETHHFERLAGQIAAEIARLLAAGTVLPHRDGPRPLRAGDFMILVQRRSPLFYRIIRACKAAGLPIAGADRLNLSAEIAVRDLRALMAFLDLPEDDLALAELLRSPLCGWTEAQLFDLAHGRQGHLWQALRAGQAGWPETLAFVSDMLDSADFLRPFELLERALTRHDGRRRLLARLGAEAVDGIDALLQQALAYEGAETPSLTGFLTWLDSGEVQIKRRLDSMDDRIRVMTVHGAKGLESPVVILPDTAKRKRPNAPALARIGDTAVWSVAEAQAPPILSDALAEATQLRAEENDRLLYVAMTRAESWLIVAAAGEVGDGACWYDRLAEGMEHAGAAPQALATGRGLRLQDGDWPEDAQPAKAGQPPASVRLPEWARLPATVPAPPPAPLSPSDLGGAKALPGETEGDEAAALRRGRLLHRLLEHLPRWPHGDWPELAAGLVAGAGEDPAPDADETATLLQAARRVLQAPALAHLFAPGSLAEVAIAADLGNRRMLGSIDRLLVEATSVTAVDFKSNAVIPARPEAVPEGIMRQMAAYRFGLTQVFPGRRIGMALLWTRDASLMTLPDRLLDAALVRVLAAEPAQYLDPLAPHP